MRLALASQGFTTEEIAKKIEELVGKFKIGADTIKEDKLFDYIVIIDSMV